MSLLADYSVLPPPQSTLGAYIRFLSNCLLVRCGLLSALFFFRKNSRLADCFDLSSVKKPRSDGNCFLGLYLPGWLFGRTLILLAAILAVPIRGLGLNETLLPS